MTTFCFYAEPQDLMAGNNRTSKRLLVGLGETDDGDRLFLAVGDGYRNFGDIELTADELRHLIDVLMENLGAMDAEASS